MAKATNAALIRQCHERELIFAVLDTLKDAYRHYGDDLPDWLRRIDVAEIRAALLEVRERISLEMELAKLLERGVE